jgi:hypothetical protein
MREHKGFLSIDSQESYLVKSHFADVALPISY